MSPELVSLDCAVIGAGMSGLVAASHLHRAGMRVAVLEQESHVGGRMASWRSARDTNSGSGSPAVFDHGAQYFTIEDVRFERLVRSWEEMGLVREWTQGFATSDGSFYADGLERYCGVPDMSAIPDHLARNLDVRLDFRTSKVEWHGTAWRIMAEEGQILAANSLILTPPVPISLALTDAGLVEVPRRQRDFLNRIEYEPCLAVMVILQDSANLPKPGGMWFLGEPIAWIADNHVKGVSPIPGAITIHAGPDFSHDQWQSTDEAIIQELVATAGEWLGSQVIDAWVKRWLYSKPFQTYPETCLTIPKPGPLVFAGDAFAGPRVEGAVLSGMAAASSLL
ncbi:MAG: FAD-dependent oxidoreductase [Candidatus Promineifilaceae bacterium]